MANSRMTHIRLDADRVCHGIWQAVLLSLLLFGCVQAAQNVDELNEREQREYRLFFDLLDEPSLPVDRKRQTVEAILDRDWNFAHRQLASRLARDEVQGNRLAIAQALARRVDHTPSLFVSPLQTILEEGEVGSSLHTTAARALGRVESDQLTGQLRSWATSRDTATNLRIGSIIALAQDRQRANVATLLQVAEKASEPTIKSAAFDALAELTGIDLYQRDLTRWKRWFARQKDVNEAVWQRRLLANHAQKAERLREVNRQLEVRLIEEQRSAYRSAAAESRDSLLVRYLASPVEPTRQLGVELAARRLSEGGLPEPLRVALRERLNDPAPAVRTTATTLLKDLADRPAAEIVAQRLDEALEDAPTAIDAGLSLLARVPIAQGVQPALRLLESPTHRDAAARVLVSVLDAGLLEETTRKTLAATVRAQVDDGKVSPIFVELLGRVAQDDTDWQLIKSWLESKQEAVRAAAAKAWGNSDQPIDALADKAGDAAIQPALYAAALKRGSGAKVMKALAQQSPEQEAFVPAWRGALIAIAERSEPRVIQNVLSDVELDRSLRHDLLTIAINRLEAKAKQAEGKLSTPDATSMVELAQSRSEIRLAAGELVEASADLDLAQQHLEAVPKAGVRQQSLRYRVALAKGDTAEALAVVKSIGELPEEQQKPLTEQTLSVTKTWIETMKSAHRFDDASAYLQSLQQAWGGDQATESIQTAIKTLLEDVAKAREDWEARQPAEE